MSRIDVEIVFALPDRQSLLGLQLQQGATVADAIAASNIKDIYPDYDVENMSVGIWGREVTLTQQLQNSDRVEIYRPLALDPREARRQLAAAGRTMSGADES